MDDNDLLEKLQRVELEISKIKFFNPIEYETIFDGKELVISLNQYLNNFNQIDSLFKKLKISYNLIPLETPINIFGDLDDFFDPFSPEIINYRRPKTFNLTFGLRVNFQKLYILIKILNCFGLEKIFYSNSDSNLINLGSINDESYKFLFSKKMEVDKILEMPFYYTTMNMLCKYHNINYLYIMDKINRDLEVEEYIDRESKDVSDDYERDSFNALTDGQSGDFDDWKQNGGNFDDLRD